MFNTTSPKMRKQILGLLTNRWALSSLAFLTLQSVIDASNTIWLVKMMENITRSATTKGVVDSGFLPYLLLYLVSLAVPYLFQCFSSIFKTTWKQEAQRSFIKAFVSSNKDNIGEWSNKGLKEEKLSILTSEGPMAIHQLIDYVWDFWSYFCSVFFNIFALSIVLEPLFAVAYAISVTCVIIVMKLQRRTQRKLTQKALTARVDLCQSLLAAWDNVLLGNEYNFKLWEEKTTQRLDRCLKRNVNLERFDQLLAIFVSLMTSVPSLMVVVYFLMMNRGDPVKISSFAVILPVLFVILSYTYQTLSLAFRWNMHRSRLTAIYRTIQSTKDAHVPLYNKIKWEKMNMTNSSLSTIAPLDHFSAVGPHPLSSCHDILQKTDQSGRLTIRGENGSGKSTALMLIKNALAKRAFFLPTQNQLSFLAETNKYSTGESLRNRLIEILDKVEADVLLLDEWDSNLDSDNREQLSQLIDELSQKKCVIEVRHR